MYEVALKNLIYIFSCYRPVVIQQDAHWFCDYDIRSSCRRERLVRPRLLEHCKEVAIHKNNNIYQTRCLSVLSKTVERMKLLATASQISHTMRLQPGMHFVMPMRSGMYRICWLLFWRGEDEVRCMAVFLLSFSEKRRRGDGCQKHCLMWLNHWAPEFQICSVSVRARTRFQFFKTIMSGEFCLLPVSYLL